MRKAMDAMFPETCYSLDSGGDPGAIPDLSYKEFKQFHATFYQSGNAQFWFSGDDPVNKRLEIISEYLDSVPLNPSAVPEITCQPMWTEPVEEAKPLPDGMSLVSVNWVISEDKPSPADSLAMEVLGGLLMRSGAPIEVALTASGLGDRIIGGLDQTLRQSTFSAGLENVSAENVPKVQALVLSELKKLVENGFDQKAVEGVMHASEFSLREQDSGPGTPLGLAWFSSVASRWAYGCDPIQALRWEEPLKELQDRLASGEKVFENMVKKLLLDNPHRLFLATPSDVEDDMAGRFARDEQRRVTEFKNENTDLSNAEEQTKQLRDAQNRPDSAEELATIPRISVGNLPKLTELIACEQDVSIAKEKVHEKMLHHTQACRGIVYLDFAFDISRVPDDLLYLLPLVTVGMRKMGSNKRNYVDLTNAIDSATGGIGATPMIQSSFSHLTNDDASVLTANLKPSAAGKVVLAGKSTISNVSKLVDLMTEVLVDVNWQQKDRFQQIVAERRADLFQTILTSGHDAALGGVLATFTSAGAAAHRMGGVAGYEALIDLENRISSDWEGVQNDLQRLHQIILSSGITYGSVTADDPAHADISSAVNGFLNALPAAESSAESNPNWAINSVFDHQKGKPLALVAPTQVNYVARAGLLPERLTGQVMVAQKILNASYLWEKVRVAGGAYGAGFNYSPASNVAAFYSYRDPQMVETWKAFEGAAAFLRDSLLPKDEVDKAIVGSIGDLDSPLKAHQRGVASMSRQITCETDKWRQNWRDAVLSTTPRDIQEVGRVLGAAFDQGVFTDAVLTNAEGAANASFPLNVRPVRGAKSEQ